MGSIFTIFASLSDTTDDLPMCDIDGEWIDDPSVVIIDDNKTESDST